MALIIKRTSKWWYALFKSNGRRKAVNLKVLIEGERPKSVGERGDDEFERSRGRAMSEHDRLQREFEQDRTAQRTLQNLAEIKTGTKVNFPALADLARHWEEIPRRKPPAARYATQCKITLNRFTTFVGRAQPEVSEFVAVKPATAKAFMEAEQARGVSPKTWNDTLKLLRATFRHLHPQINAGSNPFHGLVTKASETVNRTPFSDEELKRIVETCGDDVFIRQIIVTGICTAMRRGDCCLLKWDDVDLKAGFLSVKTAKTGERVDIPIFPLLAEELRQARELNPATDFCFPQAALMYRSNPDGITYRVKQVLARALEPAGSELEPAIELSEIQSRGLAYLDRLDNDSRAERMREVFLAYLGGLTLEQVMAKTGSSRGTVSNYLNELERETGCVIVRGKNRALDTNHLQTERDNGIRRASVRDFHSFRVTWITLALASGVPLELVQRVTGHRTVDVVLKHYFRPGRENLRQALSIAMPKMLFVGAQKSPKEQMREILEGMTAETWQADREAVLKLIGAE